MCLQRNLNLWNCAFTTIWSSMINAHVVTSGSAFSVSGWSWKTWSWSQASFLLCKRECATAIMKLHPKNTKIFLTIQHIYWMHLNHEWSPFWKLFWLLRRQYDHHSQQKWYKLRPPLVSHQHITAQSWTEGYERSWSFWAWKGKQPLGGVFAEGANSRYWPQGTRT